MYNISPVFFSRLDIVSALALSSIQEFTFYFADRFLYDDDVDN